MRALIIEDETAAVKNLTAILAEIDSNIEVIASLDSVKSSISWLTNNPEPDIIFLDINLADGQSFLIFDKINVVTPIIFTTAYDEYALDAFKLNSIDYLLKPLNSEAVKKAITKFRTFTQSDIENYSQQINHFVENRDYLKTLLISYGDKIIPLSTSEIAFFNSKNDKVNVCTLSDKIYPVDRSLDAIMNKLNPNNFFRANRQYIIAHSSVKEANVWFGNKLAVRLHVPTNEKIIISKARVADFKKWLSNN